MGFVYAYFIMVPSVVASGGPSPQSTLLALVQLQRFVLAAGLAVCVWAARGTPWRAPVVRLAAGAAIGFFLRLATSDAISHGRYREGSFHDLAWIVPQNMNVKAWQILARLLRFAPERIYFDPLPEVAHVISGDNVINLKALDASGRLERGDRILLVMAGYGLNWQCVLVEKV